MKAIDTLRSRTGEFFTQISRAIQINSESENRFKKFVYKYKAQIVLAIILALGFTVRVISFPNHPGGLNQDEASVGYDAWSIMNFGVDRNGNSIPVHLLAWGSGQNALYAYFSIPFIKIFGLNVFSVRCVNFIFSVLSVWLIYDLTKRTFGEKHALVAAALMAIAPWNIMLSRWALESNLFPAMFLLSLWAFVKAFEKRYFLYFAAVFFALSLYSYGSAYLVVTLFCAFCFVYVIIKKLIPIKTCLISLLIFTLISLPIYLFVIINTFDMNEIKLWFITIPKMNVSRMSELTGTITFKEAMKNMFTLAIEQNDSSSYNSFAFYGCLYVISLPFTIFGIAASIRRHKHFDIIMITALISSFMLFFVYTQINVNRLNAIYIPMIYFAAVGISEFIKSKTAFLSIICVYTILFSGFCMKYFDDDYEARVSREFFASFDEAIQKANELVATGSGDETVYVTEGVNMPYIYVLFYSKTRPSDYYDSVVFKNPNAAFESVASFNRYVFGFNNISKSGVYIVKNSDISKFNTSQLEVFEYENYSVFVVS